MAAASELVTASVLTETRTLKLIQRELPAPAAGELRIQVKAVGLCGSDLHYYHQMRNGDAVVREPMTLGHEAAGIVEAVGPPALDGVPSPFQPGDRVALELGTPCGVCRHCQKPGQLQYNLCPQMQFAASARKFPHCQGALQARINRPARWCFKMPDQLSYDMGALVEPLAVAVHAHRRAGLADADSDSKDTVKNILILGAGPVGLLVAAVTRYTHLQKAGPGQAGNLHIVIVDLVQDRVDFATQHGFADVAVVLPKELLSKTAEDKADDEAGRPPQFRNPKTMSERLLQQTKNGEMYDVTFECTGQESSVQTGIFSTVSGGRVTIVGMGASAQQIPLGTAAAKEVDIVGVFRYASDYGAAVRLLAEADAEQLAHVEKIISHSFRGLDQAADAFERASKPYDESGKLVLKVMIEP